MKALEASARVMPVGRDSQGTIKWPHFAAHRMPVLMLYCVPILFFYIFNVHGSVHRESISVIVQDATMYSLLYFCKVLYMFLVVTPPIIRSRYNWNYSIWHWSSSENAVYEVSQRWEVMHKPLIFGWFHILHFPKLTSAKCSNYGYMLLMMGGVTTGNM